MNKINKVRKGEVRIYKGMTYVAVPEIKEDHCTGCCFYNEGSCLIRDPDHAHFSDCQNSGMIWTKKEYDISNIKEKAIKLAIEVMKPIPVCSSPCYSISDSRSPKEKHEEEMRFCKDLNDLRCEMLIDMAKKIIGIDFDGTCVTDLYPYVGDNIGAASVLRKLADRNLLILYTVRDGRYLQDAVDWFKYNHINLYSVNYNPEPVSSSPKVYCDYYIDDRNIGTPLTDKGYVDWDKMLVLLRQKNLL